MRARVVVVRDERERPSRQYVFTKSEEHELAEREDRESYKPDGVVAFGVLNASSVPIFCDVGVYVFHQ